MKNFKKLEKEILTSLRSKYAQPGLEIPVSLLSKPNGVQFPILTGGKEEVLPLPSMGMIPFADQGAMMPPIPPMMPPMPMGQAPMQAQPQTPTPNSQTPADPFAMFAQNSPEAGF